MNLGLKLCARDIDFKSNKLQCKLSLVTDQYGCSSHMLFMNLVSGQLSFFPDISFDFSFPPHRGWPQLIIALMGRSPGHPEKSWLVQSPRHRFVGFL